MSGDRTRCANCGHVFTPTPSGEGRCPLCDAMAAPVRAEPADGPALRIRRDVTLDGRARKCTSCGLTVPLDRTVCPQCGLDAETGQYVQEVEGRRRRARHNLLRVAALVLAAAAAWAGWRFLRTHRPAEPPPAAPVPAVGEEELFRNTLERLRADLDARHPLCRPGDTLDIVLVSGLRLRGRFQGLTPEGRARIETSGGVMEVPVADVRPPWRLRVDAAYREQALRVKAREKIELGKGGEGNPG